jgi:hypothetical protein
MGRLMPQHYRRNSAPREHRSSLPRLHRSSRLVPYATACYRCVMKRDRRTRLIVALLVGCACGLASWLNTRTPGFGMQDFEAWWLAARAVAQGSDPYVAVGRVFRSGFLYPLPTALATMPLAWLPATIAGSIFAGLSSAILAFTVTRTAWWPLLMCLSGSFVDAVLMAHSSVLLTAALFAPGLVWLGVFKPNVGLGLFAFRPSWKHAAIIVGIALASLAVMPTWPLEWIETARASPMHFAPWRVPGGVLLLLAFVRWRRPEARFVGVLALMPSSPIAYEALPLFVIPRRRLEMIILVLLSDALLLYVDARADTHDIAQYFRIAAPAMTVLMYVPAVAMVLSRPNVDPPTRVASADCSTAMSVPTSFPARPVAQET